jgi:hypothetical protein
MDSAWRSDFWAFADYIDVELGVRPERTSLDRINNDCGYVPGNLRWATPKEQSENSRLARQTWYNGKKFPTLTAAIGAWVADGKPDCVEFTAAKLEAHKRRAEIKLANSRAAEARRNAAAEKAAEKAEVARQERELAWAEQEIRKQAPAKALHQAAASRGRQQVTSSDVSILNAAARVVGGIFSGLCANPDYYGQKLFAHVRRNPSELFHETVEDRRVVLHLLNP